jgi:hypothetical protein
MATYLQGVTDYIPDYQPFQPDLNFYANVMQTKQTQYDSNWKSLNNLYADLHNADLTHDQNINKKDNLLKQIDFNLKRVTGLDLSLQQNVDQATQVFRPFYEDKYLMKDMAWTKNYSNTVSRALNLKNSQDEKVRAQYWDTGVKDMQYRREEFKNATLDETLNMGNVSYTPYVNSMEKYLKLAKDTGLSIDIKDVDESGLYFVREKNGKALMSPLQSLFMSAYANDPALQAVYATQSYVKRKDYAEQHATKFKGNKVEAEKEYLREQYKFLQNYTAKKNAEAKETVDVTKNKSKATENTKNNSEANPFTDSYIESLNKALAIDQTVSDHAEKLDKDINGGKSNTISTSGVTGDPNVLDLNDMQLARLKVDAGTASILAEQDIIGAADIYAYKDYVYEKSANPVGLENLRQQNALARIDYTHQLKKDEMKLKADYDRETNRIKQGIADGTIWYDKNGQMQENDGSAHVITLGSTSGQFSDEINVMAKNAKDYNETVSNMTGTYIGNTLLRLKQLADTGEISSKEAWDALSWLDPNSKEAKTRYGTKDGKQLVYKLWNKYQNNNDKFVLDFTKSNQVIKLKKFMDGWASKNTGHSIATDYNSDKSGLEIQKYRIHRDQAAVVDKHNHDKISKNLISAMDNAGLKNLKPETKERIAELYIKKIKSGAEIDEDDFTDFVNKNLNYEKKGYVTGNKPVDEKLARLLGNQKTKEYQQYMQKEAAKWNDKNFWRSEDGKKLTASGYTANNFQEYLDKQSNKFIAQNMSDAEFKKILAKDVWKYNEAVKKRHESDTRTSGLNMTASTQAAEQLKLAKRQLATLNNTLKNDDRDIYGPNKSRLREDIARKEAVIKNLQSKVSSSKNKEDNSYKKDLIKSPYEYTDEELEQAKKQYLKGLNKQNVAKTQLYDNEGSPKYRIGFSEKTGTDMDDLFDTLSGAYLKTVNETGPDGLRSYAGYVRTKSGRYSLGTNEVTAKDVYLNKPGWGGFNDFQQGMSDINRIRFGQNPEKYAVTFGGLTKSAAKDESLDPAEMKAMLREIQMSAGKKTKTPGFKIARSSVALEDPNLRALIVVPPQSILEKYIKDEDGKVDWAKIKKIKQNGISFIAPKSEWTNDFVLENELTPTEQILNASGEMKYQHGNGAGGYTISKVKNVPGVDYAMSYSGNWINEDGTVSVKKDYVPFQKSGNLIDNSQAEIFDLIQTINEHNLEMFKHFQSTGNQKAIDNVHKYYKQPDWSGFKY